MESMPTGFERLGRDSQLQDHWIRRFVAFIIDSIIIGACTLIIAGIIAIPFIATILATGWPWYVFNPFSFPFFAGVFSVFYFALLETYYGSTIGKRLMNLGVIKLNGQKIGLDSALIRNGSKVYWILILVDTLIGLATPGDPQQKVTDRIAGTIVRSTATSPLAGVTVPQRSGTFCAYCGKKLPPNAEYCPYCGKEQH